MIHIFMSVCLLSSPAECREVTLNYETDAASVTPQQCMMYGQMEMAKWIVDHPGYRIVKWKCSGKLEKSI
jgi:hypothetical protein